MTTRVRKINISHAIKTNKIQVVKEFIEAGHRIEGWNDDEAIHFRYLVAAKSSLDMIKLLLTNGYMFEGSEYVVYKRAMFTDRTDVMKMVDVPELQLQQLLPWDLERLIRMNCTDAVKSIVFQGSATKPSYLPVVRWGVIYGHWDVIEFQCSKDPPTTVQLDNLLCACAQSGRMDMLQFFVDRGGDVEKNKNMMLQWAASFGRLGMATMLLRKGADPSFQKNAALKKAYTNSNWNIALLLSCVMRKNISTLKTVNKKVSYQSFMLTLVNMMRGYAKPKGVELNDGYYDGNLGMLVCLYLD